MAIEKQIDGDFIPLYILKSPHEVSLSDFGIENSKKTGKYDPALDELYKVKAFLFQIFISKTIDLQFYLVSWAVWSEHVPYMRPFIEHLTYKIEEKEKLIQIVAMILKTFEVYEIDILEPEHKPTTRKEYGDIISKWITDL